MLLSVRDLLAIGISMGQIFESARATYAPGQWEYVHDPDRCYGKVERISEPPADLPMVLTQKSLKCLGKLVDRRRIELLTSALRTAKRHGPKLLAHQDIRDGRAGKELTSLTNTPTAAFLKPDKCPVWSRHNHCPTVHCSLLGGSSLILPPTLCTPGWRPSLIRR